MHKTKAAPGKTHPPGKPSRPSKRICICGKRQSLLYTHTWTCAHTQVCVFMQTGRTTESSGAHNLCIWELKRTLYQLIEFISQIYTCAHEQLSSSPVWYVWKEFSQTAEIWWYSRASHGMHACSLSMPMPPPSTAVHSPSTSTHIEQNNTVTVQS